MSPFAFCQVPRGSPVCWSVPFRRMEALDLVTYVHHWGLAHTLSALEVTHWWIQFSHVSDKITAVQKSSGWKDFAKVYGALIYYSRAESLISPTLEERSGGGNHLMERRFECSRLGNEGPQGDEKSSRQERCRLIISLTCFSLPERTSARQLLLCTLKYLSSLQSWPSACGCLLPPPGKSPGLAESTPHSVIRYGACQEIKRGQRPWGD